jgi:hypothetical protein
MFLWRHRHFLSFPLEHSSSVKRPHLPRLLAKLFASLEMLPISSGSSLTGRTFPGLLRTATTAFLGVLAIVFRYRLPSSFIWFSWGVSNPTPFLLLYLGVDWFLICFVSQFFIFTFCGRLIFITWRKQRQVKLCNWRVTFFVTLQVSHQRRNDFTLLL